MPHPVLRAALLVALWATLPPPALAAAARAPLPAAEPEPPPRRARPTHHATPTPTPSPTAAAGRRVMSEREKTCRTVNRCAMDPDTPCPPCAS